MQVLRRSGLGPSRVPHRRVAVLACIASAVAGSGPLRAQDTATCAACSQVMAPVATRHLPRGTVLSERDLTVARVVLRGPQSDLPVAITGWVTRRAVRAGEVLRPPAIARRPLVPRGSVVDVAVRVGEVEVVTAGVVLRDGEMDDEVSIRLGPKRTVQGRVRGPGQVLLIDSQRTP